MDNQLPKIVLDPQAGFCSGVKRAVDAAEQLLTRSGGAYSLGELVHNEAELNRLHGLGLKIIRDAEGAENISGRNVIIRAHGEPPSVYKMLHDCRAEITDATCPVVTRLQMSVRAASRGMSEAGGTVVIYGKQGHPEITGLLGNADGNTLVVSGIGDLEKIDMSKPLRVFAQTTSDQESYNELCEAIRAEVLKASVNEPDVIFHHTVCRQVSRRKPGIEQFARNHDVIVFVSGSGSSNGKYLSEKCQKVNRRTFIVSGTGQVRPEWFADASSIGVSGATSSPVWLMEQIAGEIAELTKNG